MGSVRPIELLAPARDLLTGIEAIRHGADAVYIGAPKFGARAAAGNSVEDIRQLAAFARPYGVSIYVTLNTILYDDELEEAKNLVHELEEAGVNALIVQDFSLYAMAKGDGLKAKGERRRAKDEGEDGNHDLSPSPLAFSPLRLHASTQMDNRTAEKVAWLRDLGFEQVVLARELTLDEIREIHDRVPDVSLEVFVHGAICVSYNGQCYASQHCFGRSANRGECAQFCRMPFDLVDEEDHVLHHQRHLLSLRDMNRSNDLEALLDAGVSSLKIEGRLKDPAYVKNVVAYYRQQLDKIFRRRPEYRRSSLGQEETSFTPNPYKSFNRLFTDYFLHGRTSDMANIYTPKSMGEPIGFAIKDEGKKAKGERRKAKDERRKAKDEDGNTQPLGPLPFALCQEVHNGDGLCYINKEGELEGFRVNNASHLPPPASQPSLLSSPPHPLTSILYRNHDQQFEQQLSKPTATRKVGVRWLLKETEQGFRLRLEREDAAQVEQEFPYVHERARSPQSGPITRQLSRLGDTPYKSIAVDLEMSQEWFIPGSVLADWRRLTIELMTKGQYANHDVRPSHTTSTAPSGRPITTLPLGPITYLGNVANQTARRFYLDKGARRVDWAMEVEKPRTTTEKGLLIMTCRYCIRYELGLCIKGLKAKGEGLKAKGEGLKDEGEGRRAKALFLRLADGRRFRLHFDCSHCQMQVYAI